MGYSEIVGAAVVVEYKLDMVVGDGVEVDRDVIVEA